MRRIWELSHAIYVLAVGVGTLLLRKLLTFRAVLDEERVSPRLYRALTSTRAARIQEGLSILFGTAFAIRFSACGWWCGQAPAKAALAGASPDASFKLA